MTYRVTVTNSPHSDNDSQRRLITYRVNVPTPMTSGAAGFLLGIPSQRLLMSYHVTFFQIWMMSEAAEYPLDHFISYFLRAFLSSPLLRVADQ